MGDKSYKSEAMKHRGEFTEELSEEKLKEIFGDNNVFSNIDIVDGKGNKAGEIDVLVVFADRAIVLQAKSKKLTLAARKGNDKALKDDFKKAIQHSYDQALLCAKLLEDDSYYLRDASLSQLSIPRNFKEIYLFCIVSDHYPALTFQARQFLQYEQVGNILPPFVMDVFLLDVMAEMLQTPLQFLNYINRRVLYSESLMVMSELSALSYHLKNNLWIDEEYTHIALTEDIAVDLDIAMMARRGGTPGKKTPEGILTQLKGTTVGSLIEQIESLEDPGTISLGFMLLSLSGETAHELNEGIDAISRLSRQDGEPHNLSLVFGTGDSGITIHCNSVPIKTAEAQLGTHCLSKKHTQKAANWFGICLDPNTQGLRFAMAFEYEWEPSAQMDKLVRSLPKPKRKKKKASRGKGFGEAVTQKRKREK